MADNWWESSNAATPEEVIAAVLAQSQSGPPKKSVLRKRQPVQDEWAEFRTVTDAELQRAAEVLSIENFPLATKADLAGASRPLAIDDFPIVPPEEVTQQRATSFLDRGIPVRDEWAEFRPAPAHTTPEPSPDVDQKLLAAIRERQRQEQDPELGRTLRAYERFQKLTGLIPFMGDAMQVGETAMLSAAAGRIERGVGTSEDYGLVADSWARMDEAQRQTWLQRTGWLAAHLPKYGVEYALTGGAFGAGRQAAMGGAKNLLGKAAQTAAGRLATQAAGGVGGMAAHAAVNPAMVASKAAERMGPEIQVQQNEQGEIVGVDFDDGEALLTALPKAYLDAMIELGSERTGAHLLKIPGIKQLAQGTDALQRAVVNRWLSQPGRTPAMFDEAIKQIGWHGMLGEVLEERAGDAARLATGLESPQQNVTGLLGLAGAAAAKGDTASAQQYAAQALSQLGSEAVAFSLPGAVNVASRAFNQPPGARDPALSEKLDAIEQQYVAETPQRAAAKSRGNQLQQIQREMVLRRQARDVFEAQEAQRNREQLTSQGPYPSLEEELGGPLLPERRGRDLASVPLRPRRERTVEQPPPPVEPEPIADQPEEPLRPEFSLGRQWQELPPDVPVPEVPGIETYTTQAGKRLVRIAGPQGTLQDQMDARWAELNSMSVPQLNQEGSRYGMPKGFNKGKAIERILAEEERRALAGQAVTRKSILRKPQPATLPSQPEAQQPGATFQTSQGSTYDIDAEWRTTRTKTPHVGHATTDVGQKPRSERTVYVSPEDAREIGMHNTLTVPGGKAFVQVQDDGIYLGQEKNGQRTWSKKIAYSTKPEVGKSPVEFWDGGTRNHPGNAITSIGGSAAATLTPQPATAVDAPSETPKKRLLQKRTQTLTPAESPAADTPDERLAQWASGRLNEGGIDENEFFAQADRHFGGTRAEGRYGDSQAYDALERGVNSFLVGKTDPRVGAGDAKATVESLERLTAQLPTHKTRTGNKDLLQQFSTPPAYAYVAAWAANPNENDVVLEPSAGTGGLVAHALNAGAKVYANEIDPARAALIGSLPVERVFREDAEFVGGSLKNKMPAPSVIVMNPPFSRAGHKLGAKKVQGMDLKHIDSAMQLLQPGGRLVAIVGAGLHGRGVGFDNWLTNLPYSVRADIEVGRDVYRGYGTTFPTRLLVIDKTPREGSAVTGSAQSLAQLVELLEEVRNARPRIAQTERGAAAPESESAEPAREESADPGEGGRRPIRSVLAPTGAVGTGGPSGTSTSPGERLRPGTAGERVPDAGVGTAGSANDDVGGPKKSVLKKRSGVRSDRFGTGVSAEGEPGSGTGSGAGQPVVAEPTGQRTGAPTSEPVAALQVKQSSKRKRQDIGEATYEPYEPSVSIEGAQRHPGAIVESAAMAAISAPPITYQPQIPKPVIQGYTAEDGTKVGISDIQLEAVAAAGQAHEQKLPDGSRRGFMIGDGTGVGKAREVVGIILDNFNRGRTKALWVSKNAALLGPAKEEWKRIGGNPEQVLHQAKVASGQAVAAKNGIVFTTYGTLHQEASKEAIANGNKLSRLDQIVEWVGKDFDGVLVFDEAHMMRSAVDSGKGLDKKSASKQSLAGVDLQSRLPNARVVYLSATSATEVANLAYATRLGLWGEATPFPTVHDFINAVSAGGVAAMEKVAADMKSLGMYVARNLSFNDGTPQGRVEYDRIEHTLTDDQQRTYDKAAEAWAVVLGNMNEALKETGAKDSGHATGRARAAFWSANQRFWNGVITAMQTPAVIRAMEKDLAGGASAVIQLTNTNESEQTRALDNREDEDDFDSIDLSPRRILMDYIEKSFPTVQYEEFTDDNGNLRSRPAKDSEGNLIQNPAAVAMKEKLLDELGSLNLANRGALDMILDHFGADNAAEVTGRSERLVKREGRLVREAHGEGARKAEVKEFMDGRRRILIFSEAGGTGASYHADLTCKNQQKRHHYLLQAGWKADTAIQGLGRTHRSNQAQAPTYFLVHTNLKGQKRFISTIARRLAQLGALTKGQRQAGEAGLFSPADNLESTEAREALHQFYRDALDGQIPGVDLKYLETTLGLVMLNSQGQLKSQLPPITQFMNRVLSLPVKQQNHVFDEFQKRLDARVEQAIASGTLDQGMETVKAERIDKVSEQVVYRHPTGAETKHVTVNVFRKSKPKTWEQAQNKRVVGYVQSARSGKVAAIEDTGTSDQDKTGTLHKKYRLVGPTSVDFLTADKLKNEAYWKPLDEATAQRLWTEQLENIPPLTESQMHLLTGVLLPVWDRLPRGTAQVKRLLTSDGEQILGRVISTDDLPKVLKSLGASMNAPELTPQQAIDAVLNGKTLVLANEWRIKRSRVDGEWTIELIGPDFSHDKELERQGVFKRRVAYQTRYFLPSGANAASVLEAVTRTRPIAEVTGTRVSADDTLSLAESKSLKRLTRQSRSRNVTGVQEAGVAAADIIKTWERLFGVPIRVGGFSQRAAGLYKVMPEVIRTRESHFANLAVAAHEVAHHIDKQTHIAGGDKRHAPKIPSHLHAEVSGLDYEPKGRLFEGFAEFTRHYLTEGDAHILAPNFFEWFENDWLPGNPRWADALREAQRQARQYADQTVMQRVRSAIGRPGDDLSWTDRMKQKASTFGRWVVRRWLDRAAPLKAIQEEAAKRGADYSQKAGVYDAFMAYDMTAEAYAAQALETGVHALTDGRKLSDGLWGLAKHLHNDVERDEAIAYAWARHTMHQRRQRPGYNTGLDIEDAQQIVEYVEGDPDKHERYEKFSKGLAGYANGTLDMLVDAGALSRDARNRMVKRYGDHYFPLLRVQTDQQGPLAGGTRFVNLPSAVLGRSRKGSGRPIMDPFDALVALTIQRYSRATKARVAHLLAETLDPALGGVEGMGGLMDRIDPRKIVHEGTIDEVLKSLVEEGFVEADDARAARIAQRLKDGEPVAPRLLKWFAERHGLTVNDDLTDAVESEPDVLATISLWRNDYTPNAKKATVVIHDRNGKPRLYEMDRELYDTASGMDGLQFGAFARILRSAAQVFKVGAVGVSTGFGVTNLLRDYAEYQGRAEHVKGGASLGKPIEMVGRYIGYKARQKAGQPTDDALIETFEAAGGKLFTRLGSDIATRQRTRERKIGKAGPLNSPWHVKDASLSAVEGLQDFIAWTDAPPRLAEMDAKARELGYEARGADWYEIASGQKVNLPEHARIKMLNAAAEATVNFKRAGSLGRCVDSFVPFVNATLQASYRESRQVASLRRISDKQAPIATRQRALRYLVYLSSVASASWLAWLLRHDDDDYREQEPWLKEGYWTWGTGGRTYIRVPKPRDFGQLVANLVEASLDAWYHDDADGAVGEVVQRHALSRLPDGGGPLRAGVETFIADYDYFKDRPLTPEYLKDDPKALQATPYTLETSKAIGQIAGPALGISPVQAEHLLNGSSGGVYRRWVDTAEAAYEGRLGPEHIPFVRGLVLNRHQARSLDDFYNEWGRVKLQAKWEAANGKVSDKTAEQKARLDDYAALMTEIRSKDTRDVKGRRKFQFEPYLVGLAREALQREPLESNPSPFFDSNLPTAVKDAISDFSARKAKAVILSHGMPQKVREGDKDFEETFAKWQTSRAADEAWLREHQGSTYVRQAVDGVRTGKGFKSLLRREGQPRFDRSAETWSDHQQDLRRFNEKLKQARDWVR